MIKEPVSLEKVEESNFNFMESIDEWALRNAHILLPLAVFILFLLIGTVIGVLVSSGNMTMTESNQYYYHLNDTVKCITWRIRFLN